MIIECPSCHARAKLPESKEGAKVRCPECRFVYVAHPAGSRRQAVSSSTPTGLYIGLGVGAVVLVVGLLIVSNSGPTESNAANIPSVGSLPEPEEAKDFTGYDSEPVRAARLLHEASHLDDVVRLEQGIAFELVWEERQRGSEDGEGEEGGEAEDGAGAAAPAAEPVAWSSLDRSAQLDFQKQVIDELTEGPDKELVADWQPFDGKVTEDTGDRAVVRLQVTGYAKDVNETRSVEWKLAKDGRRWKAYAWERWFSPAEQKANRVRRARSYEKVVLSDGSVVLEAEPKRLEHYEDTPAELRKEIDGAYATMIDLGLNPRDNAKAKARLVELGKPSLPVLLTGLYEIPLETEEQAIQINLINQCLEEITGYYTGYKPQVDVGSGTGTSQERRSSAVRQWFAWWNRNWQKFEEADNPDLLEEGLDLDSMTERERWEYEKSKREHEKAQRKN